MDSLIFAVNAIMPIVLMVALGYFLKRIGWMNAGFAAMTNKLVFRVFLPAMLFLNIYKIADITTVEPGYIVYTVVVLLLLFLAALPAVMLTTKTSARRGALWQAVFRSNYALVGIPLAQSLFGDVGVAVASLLSAIVVPMLNVLAVISLTVFGTSGERPSVKRVLLGIAKNPLIQAVALGLVVQAVRAGFQSWGVDFRISDIKPIYKLLEDLSKLATPLALLCLGAQFEFSVVSALRREIVFGTLMRTLVVPVLGIGTAFLFLRNSFGGAQFASFVAVFATPVSISSVPMSQEMGGDTALAGQLVVWSTLVSTVSIFLTAFLLRAAGVF